MKATIADEPEGLGPTSHTSNTPATDGTGPGFDEEHLLEKYRPAINDWAYRYSGGNCYLRQDLQQEGALGLVQAARRFDPSMGTKFPTLARRQIRGRMLWYLREESAHHKCLSMADACYHADDHDFQNLPQEDCLPLTATDVLAETDKFLFAVDVRLCCAVLGQYLALLTKRQQQIFAMRYVDGIQPSEIARQLGVSAARITQVLSEAVARINVSFFQT
jgi:RNA polymerase sigma factor (sigma-70 family)